MYLKYLNIISLFTTFRSHCVFYAPYIPSTFRINSWEFLELTDVEIQNVLSVRPFSVQTILKW